MPDCEPIAVIGFSYRAPAVGRKHLWDFLVEAKSAFSPVPLDRFQHDAYYDPDSEKAGCMSSKGAHFLPGDIYAFDAPFFNMTADEATSIDPQHRMLLECAFEAAENAGWPLDQLAGSKTGVFAANEKSEHASSITDDLPTTTKYSATGTAACMLANRLSYFFDLHGPSISVDAACSSSSYALHLACQSLRMGDCKAAFVGGSSLIINPSTWIMLDTMGALSADGKSYSYDHKANGFGRGEGGACLVLKPMSEAVACGDPIRAVIRNTVSNHSGRTNGITAPSQRAQEDILTRLHGEIGLRPEETTFVEGHGTGTQLGDPIDAGAIANVVAGSRPTSDPVHIGSLKSNFGHLEGASGILSVVKAIMMIERKALLPNAWFEEFNKGIQERERLKVPQMVVPFSNAFPLRVCVTNFGFGGSNAAVLLEEHPSPSASQSRSQSNPIESGSHTQPRRLFVFSAKSEAALTAQVAAFAGYLQDVNEEPDFLRDLSYTLGQRRTHFSDRIAVTANSFPALQEQVADPDLCKRGRLRPHTIAFVFTGQGAQYYQMGIELYRYEVFAKTLRNADEQLAGFGATWSLIEELGKCQDETRINDPDISQPACTAIQIGLVRLLEHWGIKPQAVTGHSSGEIAASYAAGFITFESAMAISFFRGQGAKDVGKKTFGQGAMLALGVGSSQATDLIESALSPEDVMAVIAAVNSPYSVTVSGDKIAIEAVERAASAQGHFARKLKVNVAYHSPHMDMVADQYLADIQAYSPELDASSSVTCISSVTGHQHYAEDSTSKYWVQNLVCPVQFSAAIEKLVTTPCADGRVPDVLVEIGPHGALKGPIDQTLKHIASQASTSSPHVEYLPSLVRGTASDQALLELVGKLFILGGPVNLGNVNQVDAGSFASVLTGLPSYEWNKTCRYQHQSAVSRQKAHPGHAYDTLTGWKRPSSTANEHVFRQVFTLDEMPWVRDHLIAGEVMFPFTGFLSIAVGAVRALSSRDTAPRSVTAHELHIKRGLVIREEERIDLTTTLRPAELGTEMTSANVWNFEIASWSVANDWIIHCTGKIEASADVLSAETVVLKSLQQDLTHPGLREADAQAEYKLLDQTGMVYGPEFRTMQKLWHATGLVVHETELRDLDQSIHDRSAVSTDAPTLDSFLHFIGMIQGSQTSRRVFVPTYFGKIKISNQIQASQKQRFWVATRLESLDLKTGTLRVKLGVFLKPSGDIRDITPVVEVESFVLRSITEPDIDKELSQLPKSYYERLVPSLDFVSPRELVHLVGEEAFDEEAAKHRQALNNAGAYYMVNSLATLTATDKEKLPAHFSSFVQWAERLAADPSTQKMLKSLDAARLVEEVRAADAKGEMLVAVGQQLPSIFRLEIEPLEIMLKDGLLSRNYEQDSSAHRCHSAANRFVCRLADSNPNLRILEIGAGTGSASQEILEAALREGQDIPSLREYVFTDISTGFFENARAKLSRWSNQVRFEKLDISKDPVAQGFGAGTYDLVVASNVLHATPNMVDTVANVKTLLKPGGRLLLIEVVSHQTCNMPYGLLPGWWLGEDEYRNGQGPLLSKDSWHRLLSANGFSGVDGAIDDYPGDSAHSMTAMWATRLQESAHDMDAIVNKQIAIAGQFEDNDSIEFAEALVEQAERSLGSVLLCTQLAEVHAVQPSMCIFVDSPASSLFRDLSGHDFDDLQRLFKDVYSLLWVIPENASPDAYMIKGLLRTLRLEDTTKNLILIENVPRSSEGAATVTQLAERLVNDHHEAETWSDQDFAWHDGMIQVPRMTPSKTGNQTYASEAGVLIKEHRQIFQSKDEAFEMTVDVAGSLDSIYFHRTDALRAPGDGEVVVRVDVVGVNFRDLLLVLGSMPWTGPGLEGSGVIHSVGAAVTDLRPGDRVCYLSNANGYANYVRLPATSVCRISDDLTSVDAATVPIAYSTALICFERANLQKGDTVLIHAASGAVGQACIALAKHMGVSKIFATCGAPEKKAFLQDTFGIPEDCIFSSRNAKFKDGILSATNGRGVDIVINSLSGDLLQKSFMVVADFGRFIEIGRKDFLLNNHLGMRAFDRNITFSGVDLYKLFTQKPQLLKESLCKIMRLLDANPGSIIPIRPVTAMPVSQIAAALRKLQSGQNMGKIVITMDRDSVVLAEAASGLRATRSGDEILSADGTYLITGGTGGIGRGLARWMVENGARNVVLLGRSAATNPDVAKLLSEYSSSGKGVHLRAIPCDVGSTESLKQALSAISDLPRLRGVVHGAMFLRDAFFMNSTAQDWQDITAPKLQGAWNLHELLPKDLDFFVSLASIDGLIGHVGQSIYGGTSTFLDEFSRYRNKLGLPTVSISLPAVDGIGYAADRDINQRLKQSIGLTLAERHVYTAVKGAIIGPSSGLNADGRSLPVTLNPVTNNTDSLLPWERFNPLAAWRSSAASDSAGRGAKQSWTKTSTLMADVQNASDPHECLQNNLMDKVSVMTMINREDIRTDKSLDEYGLDSLVSVELRNWIRREFGAELALTGIVGAEDLRALSEKILSLMPAKA